MQTGFGHDTGSREGSRVPSDESTAKAVMESERSLAAYRVEPSAEKARCRGLAPPVAITWICSIRRPSSCVAYTAIVSSPRLEAYRYRPSPDARISAG